MSILARGTDIVVMTGKHLATKRPMFKFRLGSQADIRRIDPVCAIKEQATLATEHCN
jgi:hypothetical protein